MKNILIILKKSQGIFGTYINFKYSTREDITYGSMREDKINMRSDILTFFTDFKKSINKAEIK